MGIRVGFFLLPLVVLPSTFADAQQLTCPASDPSASVGAVVGQVVDAETRVPMGFAQLLLRIQGVEVPFETRSNTSGWFQFCSVPSGVFTLTGQLGQFGGLVGPLTLEPGNALTVSLELGASPSDRAAGTLTGIVIDANSEEPIEGATVLLPSVGQTAVSNALGRFTLPALVPGVVDLQINRLGYAETAGQVEIEVGRTSHIRALLSIEPITLDPITVTAVRRRIELPGLEDFERRFHGGQGQFILEEDIQRRAPTKLTQMLTETGVTVMGDGKAIYMRRTRCAPLVYLDGVKLTHTSRGGGAFGKGATLEMRKPANNLYPDPSVNAEQEAADAVNLVHPSAVRAVEIYRGPAETPGQYLDSNSQCGVILIWTRRGDISGH